MTEVTIVQKLKELTEAVKNYLESLHVIQKEFKLGEESTMKEAESIHLQCLTISIPEELWNTIETLVGLVDPEAKVEDIEVCMYYNEPKLLIHLKTEFYNEYGSWTTTIYSIEPIEKLIEKAKELKEKEEKLKEYLNKLPEVIKQLLS